MYGRTGHRRAEELRPRACGGERANNVRADKTAAADHENPFSCEVMGRDFRVQGHRECTP